MVQKRTLENVNLSKILLLKNNMLGHCRAVSLNIFTGSQTMKIEVPSLETLEAGDVSITIHSNDGEESVLVCEVSRWPNREAAEEYMRFLRLEAEGLLSGTMLH